MREYNVALNAGVDYDEFWNDIESDTDGGKLYIPNRAVEFTNERVASLRQCWYLLTDEEAEILRQDERVYCVEIPPEQRTDIKIGRTLKQKSDFTKTTSNNYEYVNWGLIRCNFQTNPYASGIVTSSATTSSFEYNMAGAGVDVVIQDSGLQVDHPEFTDANGVTRVQQINWGTVSGLFTQNANHYRDYDGHGTHVAGITAGKTYGWAKDAQIYSLKVNGLEGSGDSGTGVSVTYCFDAIKIWHANKSIQPLTGAKRPTIVNMSWGYSTEYNTVTSVTYRGTTFTDTNTKNNSTYRNTNYGIYPVAGASYTYSAPFRVSSVDVDVEEMIDAGIVVCIAAGNSRYKIDVSGGTDYDNNIVTDQGTIYYHRGSSPYSTKAFMVGSIDSTPYSGFEEKKAAYSCTGPGVNIYAPGTDIMSSTSNTVTGFTTGTYYLNSAYKQMNISGTSMAAPQICGIAALLCGANPKASVATIRESLISNAASDLRVVLVNNDWTDYTTLKGGTPTIAYNKFNKDIGLNISGELEFRGQFSYRIV
jgi:hypothetical protein